MQHFGKSNRVGVPAPKGDVLPRPETTILYLIPRGKARGNILGMDHRKFIYFDEKCAIIIDILAKGRNERCLVLVDIAAAPAGGPADLAGAAGVPAVWEAWGGPAEEVPAAPWEAPTVTVRLRRPGPLRPAAQTSRASDAHGRLELWRNAPQLRRRSRLLRMRLRGAGDGAGGHGGSCHCNAPSVIRILG